MRRPLTSPSARSVLFAPLDQTGRAELVARRLVDAITLGVLADQEQLPSEAELAEQFGVSTVTVREALVALRQQGLVQTKRGRGGGSFVCAPPEENDETWRARLREVSLSELRDIGDDYVAIAARPPGWPRNAARPRTSPASSSQPRTSTARSVPRLPAPSGSSTWRSPPRPSPPGSPTRRSGCRANRALCCGCRSATTIR